MTKKIKNEEMDIVFLLDRSGSMGGIETDTIGGYNSYIKEQKKNNVKVTTVLFDDRYEVLHQREKINDIKELTNKEYFVRGSTALLDAIGRTINYMDEQKSKKAIFVITTDGLENASSEYTKEKIKKLIESHPTWEFIYIGANIDSYSEGASLGISRKNIANYSKSKKGTKALFDTIGELSECMYCEKRIDDSWKNNLEQTE